MLFEYLLSRQMSHQKWVDKPYDNMWRFRRNNKVLWDLRGLSLEVVESFTRVAIRGRASLREVWRLYNLGFHLTKNILRLSFYKNNKCPCEQFARTPPLQGLMFTFHWHHNEVSLDELDLYVFTWVDFFKDTIK